jgi:hypothetical protein
MGFSLAMGRCPQRGAVDTDGNAMMVETIQEGVDEILSLKEVVPRGI